MHELIIVLDAPVSSRMQITFINLAPLMNLQTEIVKGVLQLLLLVLLKFGNSSVINIFICFVRGNVFNLVSHQNGRVKF